MGGWIELFRSLGQALVEVYKAELGEVGKDLSTSGRQLGIALGLFAAAAAVGFWTLAALLYFAIQLLARLGLPLWGAAGVVTLVLLILVALLGGLGYRRLQRVESPVRSVRRRFEDHQAWWSERMLPAGERTAPGEQRQAGVEEGEDR